MSLAKVHRAAKARKVWTCGKCKATINVGEPVLSYSVGFRGREQRRCTKPECYPTRSERESSLVAGAYDAIDSVDWEGLTSLDEIKETMQDVSTAIQEVAGEYEQSEMFDKNPDLQERAEILNGAADAIDQWEPSLDEPNEFDRDTWDGHDTYAEALEAWVITMRDEARDTVDGVELP